MDASLNMASLRELDVALKFFSRDRPHFCFTWRAARARGGARARSNGTRSTPSPPSPAGPCGPVPEPHDRYLTVSAITLHPGVDILPLSENC